MKGYNFFYVPLALIGFILVVMITNVISFTEIERTIMYMLGFLLVGLFLVLAAR